MKRAIFKTVSVILILAHLWVICLKDAAFAEEKPAASVPAADSSSSTQATSSQSQDTPPVSDTAKSKEASSSTSTTKSASTAFANPPELLSGIAGFNAQAVQVEPFAGQANFSLPIITPPGRAGMQPQIALTYSSNNGNGFAGMGWGLNLDSIQRSTKRGVPKYNSTDTFILASSGSSQELVEISSNQYRTKIEGGFTKITSNSNSWVMTDKTGKIYYFGLNSNSQQTNSLGTFAWYLNKVVDLKGNTLEIEYTLDQGQIYPARIKYTLNGESYAYTAEFILEARSDITTTLRSGAAITTAKRLKEILVKYNNTLTRKYALTYSLSSSSSRSLLTTITQYGKDGITCLPPIQFSYLEKRANFETTTTWPGVVSYPPNNACNSSIRVLHPEGFYYIDTLDLNGDGLPDRVRNSTTGTYDHWEVQINNGSGFNPVSTWPGVISSPPNNNANSSIRVVHPEGFTYIDILDINGDGLPDRVKNSTNGTNDHWEVQLNNGHGFEPVTTWTGVYTKPNNNYCNSSIRVLHPEGFYYIDVLDLNGDGLADRLMNPWNGNFNHWDIQINKGQGFGSIVTWSGVYARNNNYAEGAIRVIHPEGFTYIDTFDLNGDGLPDRVRNSSTSQNDHWEVQINSDYIPDLLVGVDNGLGGSTTIAYNPSTKYQNNGSDDKPDLPFPVPVVSSITSSDGRGSSYTTNYNYKDGLYSWTEREFRGFGYVKTTDPEGNFSESYFKQDDIFKGRAYKQETKNSEGTLYSRSENTWASMQVYPGVNFAYLAQTDNYIYEGQPTPKHTRVSFTYDLYGNPATVVSQGDVEVTGDEKTQVTEYTYNTANWILATPKHTRLLDPDQNTVSEKWLYYDNHLSINDPPTQGFLTKEEVLVFNPLNQQSYRAATRYTYDTYGNPLTVTDPLNHTTTVTYEPETHTYPKFITNSLNQTLTQTYDLSTGQILTSTDPNNQTTINVYDVLGRLIKVLGPQDTQEYPGAIYEYDLTTRPIKVTKRVKANYTQPINYLTSYEFYDGLGRLIEAKSPAEDESDSGEHRQIISGIVKYDSRGQTKEKYLPYFVEESALFVEPAYTTPHFTFSYDALGRLLQITNPDSTTSSVSYSIWSSTSTDENGHTKSQYLDAYGRTIKIEEHQGTEVYTTTYEYDTLGSLTKTTDNQGNSTLIWHDSLGRKLKMSDPDMGLWLYEYDAAGNLTKQTDAKGQILNFTYDSLNRLISKQGLSPPKLSGTLYKGTVPDGSQGLSPKGTDPKLAQGTVAIILATYQYDDLTKPNCIGRLSKVTDLSGSTDFYYDTLGREIKSIKTISGSGSYTVQREYDALDRLTKLTYPDNSIVQYTYNPQGIETVQGLFPQSQGLSPSNLSGTLYKGTVPELLQTYVANINYSPTNQITKIQYGNSTETNYSYNPNTLRLTNISTVSPRGRIQDLSYHFDNVGNIVHISDYVNTNSQSFLYDDLNRLTQAQGDYGSFTYAYDSIGNMLEKEGVTLTYGRAGGLPHAVTQYGSTPIQYDANGNMIHKGLSPAGGLSLNYDVENRLVSTSGPSPADSLDQPPPSTSITTRFTYDGDGGRVKKGLSPQGTVPEQWTLYIGSLYEVESDGTLRKHIFSGANRVCSIEEGTIPVNSQGLSPKGTDPAESGAPNHPIGLGTSATKGTVPEVQVRYFHSDHLGSSNVITDLAGQQVTLTEFTPYGSTFRQTGSYDPKHKFTGKELDSSNGLYFYGARYYDPELGRFISADTIVQAPYDPQSLNRYAYCRNNPINLVDPSGNFWFIPFLIGIIKGMIAGALIGGAMAAATGSNIAQGFLTGAISGAIFGGIGGLGLKGLAHAAAHTLGGAASGAASGAVTGGDIGMNALIGGLSAGASERLGSFGPLKDVVGNNIGAHVTNMLRHAFVGAVVGGITSTSMGESFGYGAKQGAITSAIAYTANQALHEGAKLAKDALNTDKNKPELAPSDVNKVKCKKACGEGWNQNLVPDAPSGVSFTEPCVGHDCCCACTGDKAKCADNFLTDMLKACAEGPSSLQEGCVDWAKGYYNVVRSPVGKCDVNYNDCRNCKK